MQNKLKIFCMHSLATTSKKRPLSKTITVIRSTFQFLQHKDTSEHRQLFLGPECDRLQTFLTM